MNYLQSIPPSRFCTVFPRITLIPTAVESEAVSMDAVVETAELSKGKR